MKTCPKTFYIHPLGRFTVTANRDHYIYKCGEKTDQSAKKNLICKVICADLPLKESLMAVKIQVVVLLLLSKMSDFFLPGTIFNDTKVFLFAKSVQEFRACVYWE